MLLLLLLLLLLGSIVCKKEEKEIIFKVNDRIINLFLKYDARVVGKSESHTTVNNIIIANKWDMAAWEVCMYLFI